MARGYYCGRVQGEPEVGMGVSFQNRVIPPIGELYKSLGSAPEQSGIVADPLRPQYY